MPRNIAILPALALMTSGAIAQTPQTADAKRCEMLSRGEWTGRRKRRSTSFSPPRPTGG